MIFITPQGWTIWLRKTRTSTWKQPYNWHRMWQRCRIWGWVSENWWPGHPCATARTSLAASSPDIATSGAGTAKATCRLWDASSCFGNKKPKTNRVQNAPKKGSPVHPSRATVSEQFQCLPRHRPVSPTAKRKKTEVRRINPRTLSKADWSLDFWLWLS